MKSALNFSILFRHYLQHNLKAWKKISRVICIFYTQTILSSYEDITALYFLKFSVFCHIQDIFLSHEKKMVGPFESQYVSKNT